MPGRVKMVIHEPIDMSNHVEKDDVELIEEVKRRIASALPKD
jgi:hypothetical protein